MLGPPVLSAWAALAVLAKASDLSSFASIRCNTSSKLPTPLYADQTPVFTVCAEREIAAPVSKIYDALLDFDNYHTWNSFVIDVKAQEGSTFVPGPEPFGFRMKFITTALLPWINTTSNEIVSLTEPKLDGPGVAMNAWKFEGPPGLRAEHPNVLTDLGDGRTRYVSWESYYGWLATGPDWLLNGKLQESFERQGEDLASDDSADKMIDGDDRRGRDDNRDLINHGAEPYGDLTSFNFLNSASVKADMDAPAEEGSTSQHLQDLCQSFVGACNRRELSRSYPVWDFFAPTFRAEPDLDPDHKIVNLDELLAQIRTVIADNPTHHIEIFTFDTKVTEKTGNAHVFMTTEITGCPEGVRRQNAVIFEFKMIEGQWRAIWYRGLRGTGGLDSGFGGL